MGEFFVCAALCTYPADAALSILLDNDRLCLIFDTLKQEMLLEVQSVLDLGFEVFQALEIATSVSALRLHDQAVQATLVVHGYLVQRFHIGHQEPWKQLRLQPEEALRSIENLESEPSDRLIWQIWSLLRLGWRGLL